MAGRLSLKQLTAVQRAALERLLPMNTVTPAHRLILERERPEFLLVPDDLFSSRGLGAPPYELALRWKAP